MIRHHANFYTNRLVKEWLKNGKIIIACDLDDTIIPYNEEIKENKIELMGGYIHYVKNIETKNYMLIMKVKHTLKINGTN